MLCMTPAQHLPILCSRCFLTRPGHQQPVGTHYEFSPAYYGLLQ